MENKPQKNLPTYDEWIETFDKSSVHLLAMAGGMDFPWMERHFEDPRELHNMYARALICAYARKFGEMCKSVADSLRADQYLLYALAGRSLVETTATLRYYVLNEYTPLLSKGSLSNEDMKGLLAADDRHLRGGRFDWKTFLEGKYSEMVAETQRELTQKKKGGKRYIPPNLMNEQKNVYTCIEKWAVSEPGALLTYNLFCELVHPNVGSNFLVASFESGVMHFGSGQGTSMGRRIAQQSVPLLGALVIREFGESLYRLMATIWKPDELPASSVFLTKMH